MLSKNQNLHYTAPLGLKKDPFSTEPDLSFYYAFESFEQRFGLFKDLVEGTDVLVLVSGKPGSGKTILLNRYLASSGLTWKLCRIRANPSTDSSRIQHSKAQNSYPAYIFQDSREPIAIVDDAHKLHHRQLELLLREALLPRSSSKIRRLVLLGETNLFAMVTNLAKELSPEVAVNQIYLPGLEESETAAYLNYRLAVAGYAGRNLFKSSVVKKIHQISEGFPGLVNAAADQWLNDNYSHGRKGRGFMGKMTARPLFTFGWIALTIAFVALAAFFIYPHRKEAMSLLQDLKSTPKVFRTTFSDDIKMARNIFRQKIPPSDEPTQSKIELESFPPVEERTVPSRPTHVPSEAQEPDLETGPDRSLSFQAKMEPVLPVEEKSISSQQIVAVPEKQEPQETSDLSEPLPAEKKLETPIPLEEPPISSQPAVVLAGEEESPEEAEKQEPLKPQTEIEMPPPEEKQSALSESRPGSSELAKLPEKAEHRQADMQPPRPEMGDSIEKTEERSIRREKWLLSQKPASYTIQLMGVRDEALLFDFIKKYQLLRQNEVALYQTRFKDKPWFQLLYGIYASKKDALLAADNLPPKIRQLSPWVRRLSGVQKAIRRLEAQ